MSIISLVEYGFRLSTKSKLKQIYPHNLSIIFCWELSGPYALKGRKPV